MDAIDKLDEMTCSECGGGAEYFFSNQNNPDPLCKECLADVLIDECNDVMEIQDLDDEDEDDRKVIDILYENKGKR